MIECLNCKGTDFEQFFEEELPCVHCSEVNHIRYVVCTQCGFVAKVSGDIILNGVLMAQDDSPNLMQLSVEDLVKDLADANEAISEMEFQPRMMGDLVHRCLKCATVSYEKEPGLFHCPDCGFEWEIITGV